MTSREAGEHFVVGCVMEDDHKSDAVNVVAS